MRMPGTTISVDEWVLMADNKRAWLHIHGVITDSEDDKAKKRIMSQAKEAMKKGNS